MVSRDELRALVAKHEELSSDERRLIDDVFAASERTIGEIMVPRTEVVFLDASMTVSRAARLAVADPYQRYPVVGDNQDDVVGYVALRDLLMSDPRAERDRTVAQLTRDITALPGTKPVLAALSELRTAGQHIVLVVDEYGGTDGIVTLDDLVAEIVGEAAREDGMPDQDAPRIVGEAVELDGKANRDEVEQACGFEMPDGPFATAGGFVMAALGRLAKQGDVVHFGGFELVVVAVEGRRASRIRIARPADETISSRG